MEPVLLVVPFPVEPFLVVESVESFLEVDLAVELSLVDWMVARSVVLELVELDSEEVISFPVEFLVDPYLEVESLASQVASLEVESQLAFLEVASRRDLFPVDNQRRRTAHLDTLPAVRTKAGSGKSFRLRGKFAFLSHLDGCAASFA